MVWVNVNAAAFLRPSLVSYTFDSPWLIAVVDVVEESVWLKQVLHYLLLENLACQLTLLEDSK